MTVSRKQWLVIEKSLRRDCHGNAAFTDIPDLRRIPVLDPRRPAMNPEIFIEPFVDVVRAAEFLSVRPHIFASAGFFSQAERTTDHRFL